MNNKRAKQAMREAQKIVISSKVIMEGNFPRPCSCSSSRLQRVHTTGNIGRDYITTAVASSR